jgi:hypothetical protein
MIADLHFDKAYQYDIEPNVVLAYQDNNVRVYKFVSDLCDSAPVDINEFVPSNRCYRIGGKTHDHAPIQLKYSDRVVKLLLGTLWIVPENSGKVYEVCTTGFDLFHDYFNEASQEQSISTYQFRTQHPELDYVFNLDDVRSIVKDIPVLGASVAPANMPTVFAEWTTQWQDDIKQRLLTSRYCDYVILLAHRTAITSLGLPYKILDQRWNMVPYVVSDELRLSGEALIESIVNKLTVDNIDCKITRAAIVHDVINTWASGSRAARLLNKLNGSLPDSLQYYMNVVANYIGNVIIKDLDISLLDTIGQQHEE